MKKVSEPRTMRSAGASVKREDAFRKRIVDELAHRLRNKLATIQLRDEIFSPLTALSANERF